MLRILFDNFIRDHCEKSTNWIELNILHVAFSDYCAKQKSIEWTNEHIALNKLTTLTLAIEAGGIRKGSTRDCIVIVGISLVSYPI
jgi:hypothetical protein